MSYLEKKYIQLLGTSLRNFKRKSDNLYNWSCTFCGDSQKNRRKARAYAYEKDGKFLVTCHNCGLTVNVPRLLKEVSPLLHQEYVKELMLEKYGPKRDKVEEFTEQVKRPLDISWLEWPQLVTIDRLPNEHICKQYVEKRQIPKEWHKRLRYCPSFMQWTNTLIPDKFSEDALRHDEPRLIIPFTSKDGKVFGYQGRSLKPDAEAKYISIILDDSYPKIFGMDTVDEQRKFYVFEGPIDAMFIPNSVAAAGGELLQVVGHLNKKNAVLVFDNEPRSKETVKKMNKAIMLDYKVCIWPPHYESKDVNEMVISCENNQAGGAAQYIQKVIDENTKSGLETQLALGKWRKC